MTPTDPWNSYRSPYKAAPRAPERLVLVRCQYESRGGSEGSTTAVVAFRSATEPRRGTQLGTDFARCLTAPRSRIFATLVYLRQKSTSGLLKAFHFSCVFRVFHDPKKAQERVNDVPKQRGLRTNE